MKKKKKKKQQLTFPASDAGGQGCDTGFENTPPMPVVDLQIGKSNKNMSETKLYTHLLSSRRIRLESALRQGPRKGQFLQNKT